MVARPASHLNQGQTTFLFRTGVFGFLLSIALGALGQANYPNKPIRMVVAFAPGGIADFAARSVSGRLAETLGVPVVVENKAGAGGIIGAELVAKSAPDGHTLLVTSISHTINPSVTKNLPFDTQRDFAPVMLIADAPNILVLHPSVQATSLPELIQLLKRKPGELNYASSGTGTSTHLCGELFKAMAGVELQHVPYKGGGPAVADLLGGQVQLMFATLPTVLEHVRAGKLRAIGVTGARRFAGAPEIPTLAEAGLPGYEVSGWSGLFAPARTPRSAIDRLAAETAKILADPALKERFIAQGAEPAVKMPDEFGAFVAAELVKWRKVVDASGMKAN
ncbi:MAG TPA: tripartite tricarboxylate transporter substrate binding protein [Burkholderiales bacterium]|nr:tripartite tricarboxylate transporter substrate binding protein [Burkholderiales bacterium]